MWRFRMASHEGQEMWRGFNRYQDVEAAINEELMFGLTNQALVIVTKFLEVWNDFGPRLDGRVIPCRKAVQPLVDRMQVWKGLDAFRNTTLAHAYLDKSGQLLPPWELIKQELAPSYHAEIILLLQCVVFAVLSILLVFAKEYLPLDSITGPGSLTPPSPGPGISTGPEIEKTLRSICAEVDHLLKQECGVTPKGPVYDGFKKSLQVPK